VRHGIKIPAAALGLLTAALVLSAVGCGAPAGSTVESCASYGAHAIEHHVTVTRTPPPCHGLTAAQINQAVGIAIVRVAGGAPKAVWRKRAARAGRYLSGLVTTPSVLPTSPPAQVAAAGPLGGRDAGMDTGALIAWLVTAGSGLYVLLNWLSHGGTLRARPRGTGTGTGTGTGSPPVVIFGHFGLALAGLVIWIGYLVAGWNVLAWTAVAVLLPVAGLGMAVLAIGLPATTATASAIPATATAATAGIGAGGVGVLPATQIKRRLWPLLVVAHGALAVTTMALVLLAAIGT
jgi:hypothetical protein